MACNNTECSGGSPRPNAPPGGQMRPRTPRARPQADAGNARPSGPAVMQVRPRSPGRVDFGSPRPYAPPGYQMRSPGGPNMQMDNSSSLDLLTSGDMRSTFNTTPPSPFVPRPYAPPGVQVRPRSPPTRAPCPGAGPGMDDSSSLDMLTTGDMSSTFNSSAPSRFGGGFFGDLSGIVPSPRRGVGTSPGPPNISDITPPSFLFASPRMRTTTSTTIITEEEEDDDDDYPPDMSSRLGQSSLNATYNVRRPNSNATYNVPGNATYNVPNANATYNAPRNPNATYNVPQNANGTYNVPCPGLGNSTYDVGSDSDLPDMDSNDNGPTPGGPCGQGAGGGGGRGAGGANKTYTKITKRVVTKSPSADASRSMNESGFARGIHPGAQSTPQGQGTCGNATYNVPRNVNATYNLPRNANATYNVPRNPNATYNVPQNANATYNVPGLGNATYNVGESPSSDMNESGFARGIHPRAQSTPQRQGACGNATYNVTRESGFARGIQPGAQSTPQGQGPCGNATFNVPQNANATYNVGRNQNATYNVGRNPNATYNVGRNPNATYNVPQNANATYKVPCPGLGNVAVSPSSDMNESGFARGIHPGAQSTPQGQGPCGNATYNVPRESGFARGIQPGAQSTPQGQGPCGNATYNVPQNANATYNVPRNANATYIAPRNANATYNAPRNPNATYNVPQNANATYNVPQNANATYNMPCPGLGNATYNVAESPSSDINESGFARGIQPGAQSTPQGRPAQGQDAGSGAAANLTYEVAKHLSEMEQTEREQINVDLSMFHQARRRLLEDTVTISTTENNAENMCGGTK